MSADHKLPHDENAEKVLLASCLFNLALCERGDVFPHLFYHDGHRALYQDLVRIHADYGAVPLENLPIYLPEKLHPLFYDLQDVASSADPGPVVKLLREFSERRRLIVEAESVAAAAANPDRPVTVKDSAVPDSWPIESLRVGKYLKTEPKPVDWLVDFLLLRGIVALVYGPGGSFKTWLLIQLCVLLVVADQFEECLFLGAWCIKKARRVLYCYPEDISNDFHYRLKLVVDRLCEQYADLASLIREKVEERFLFLSREQFFDGDTSGLFDIGGQPTPKWERLCRTVEEAQIDILIIDTKSVCTATEENDNNANAELIKHLGFLRDRTGITIVLVHHVNKASRTSGDGENAFRGASALLANSRGAIYVRPKDCNGIEHIEVMPIKVTAGEKQKKILCSLAGFPWFTKVDALEDDPEELEERHIVALLEYLRDHPGISGKMLAEAKALKKTIGGKNRIYEILKISLDNAIVRREGLSKNTRYYAV